MTTRKVTIGCCVVAVVVAACIAVVPVVLTILVASMLGGGVQMAQAAADPCSSPEVAAASTVVPSGGTVAPIPGRFTYTSAYGMRMHPVLHRLKMHGGIDLVAVPGPGPVVAVASGTVLQTAPAGSAGNMVVVDHGAGVRTTSMHLASMAVTTGQSVVAGQRLGIEGATGRVTGVHLHFEVHVDGRSTEPLAWLRSRGVTMPALRGVATGAPEARAGTAGSDGPGAGATPAGLTSAPLPNLDLTKPLLSKPLQDALPERIGPYRGEQLLNAARIIKVGRDMNLDERAIAIGLMTAMGESSLINVPHGDKAGPDSRGLFQQRDSWGPLATRMDPASAARLFFEALARKVPGYASMSPTLVAHAVQVNQDPYHYAPFWGLAVQVLSTLTDNPGLFLLLPASDASAVPCDPATVAASTGAGAPLPLAALPGAPPGTCPTTTSPAERGLQPGALRGLRCGAAAFGRIHTFYGVGTRPGVSDHPAGRAVDFMIEDYRTPAGRAYGWQVAQWFRANAAELGVTNVIFDMQTWSAQRPTWKPYTRYGPNPDDNLGHRNHVHVSF